MSVGLSRRCGRRVSSPGPLALTSDWPGWPARSGLGSGVCVAAPAVRPRGPVSAAPSARQPVDRDPVVCHPDLEELLQAWPAELPDEFFEVTVDDVRRRLAQLKSERWVCHRRFRRLPAPTSSVARLRVRASRQAPRPPVPSVPLWRGGPRSPGGCVVPLLSVGPGDPRPSRSHPLSP